VPLPDTSYRDPWAFVISKNNSYKGIINWRWDNKIKSITYITVNSRLLWVSRKVSQGGGTYLSIISHKCFNYNNLRMF
jgi:hypothetical protein